MKYTKYFNKDTKEFEWYSESGRVTDAGIIDDLESAECPGDCDDFEITELFFLDPDSVTRTLRNREYEIGPRESPNRTVAEGSAIRKSFDAESDTTIDADWDSLRVNDTNNDPSLYDLQIIEGYIIVERPIMVRWQGGSLGYFALELGICCGPLGLIVEGASGDGTALPTAPASIPRGIHAIRMWNIDDFQNTNRNVQYSLDGGNTWPDTIIPPSIRLSRAKPYEICKKVRICKPDGAIIPLIADALIDDLIEQGEAYDCALSCSPICCGGGGSEMPQTARIVQ